MLAAAVPVVASLVAGAAWARADTTNSIANAVAPRIRRFIGRTFALWGLAELDTASYTNEGGHCDRLFVSEASIAAVQVADALRAPWAHGGQGGMSGPSSIATSVPHSLATSNGRHAGPMPGRRWRQFFTV